MSTLGHWYSSFTLGTKNEEKSKRFNHFFLSSFYYLCLRKNYFDLDQF